MNDAAATLQAFAPALLHSFIAYGVIITCVALGGLAGLRLGLFRSIVNFACFVFAALAAFLGSDLIGGLLKPVGCPPEWAMLAGFVSAFVAAFAIAAGFFWLAVRAEVMTYPRPIDRLGGAAIGVIAGLLLANMVRIGFAMTPLAASNRPSLDELRFDSTTRMLQLVARIVSPDADSRRSWLFGEQGEPVDPAGPMLRTVWSEPFVDENGNGQHDRDEPFLDKDSSGKFTREFAQADIDREPRVGVMERYWLGNWARVMIATGSRQRTQIAPN